MEFSGCRLPSSFFKTEKYSLALTRQDAEGGACLHRPLAVLLLDLTNSLSDRALLQQRNLQNAFCGRFLPFSLKPLGQRWRTLRASSRRPVVLNGDNFASRRHVVMVTFLTVFTGGGRGG